MNISEVTRLLISVTREGPVSQWVDRIGIIADKAGLDLASICWQGDPNMVVFAVYQEAERCRRIQHLIDACKTAA